MSKKQDTLTALSILLVGTIVLGALFVPRGDSRAEVEWEVISELTSSSVEHTAGPCPAEDDISVTAAWTQPYTPYPTRVELESGGEIIRETIVENNEAGSYAVMWDDIKAPQDLPHRYDGYSFWVIVSEVRDDNSYPEVGYELAMLQETTDPHEQGGVEWAIKDEGLFGGSHHPGDPVYDNIGGTLDFTKESQYGRYVVEIEGIEVIDTTWFGGCSTEFYFAYMPGNPSLTYNPKQIPHTPNGLGLYQVEARLYEVDDFQGSNPQLKDTFSEYIYVPHTSPTPSHTPYPSP